MQSIKTSGISVSIDIKALLTSHQNGSSWVFPFTLRKKGKVGVTTHKKSKAKLKKNGRKKEIFKNMISDLNAVLNC